MISPLWYLRIGAVLLICGALAWLHHHIYQQGWDARDLTAQKEMKAEKEAEAAANAEAETKLVEANKKVDALNLQMTQTLSEITAHHQQEISNANTKITQLSADLRSAKLRLSIAIDTPSKAAGADQGQGAGPGPIDSSQGRADLLPEDASFLVSVAAGGDAAVRRANACVDAYNALKEAVNAETNQ